MWDDLTDLIDEIRQTFNALAVAVDELHAESAISAHLRAVLEYLLRNGPTTVPDIARARRVSRQHIQTAVNELRALLLVDSRPNPSHRRSPLMELTAEGQSTIVEMRRLERLAFEHCFVDVDPADVAIAADTVRALRQAIPERGDQR